MNIVNMRPDGLTSPATTLTLGPKIEPVGHLIIIYPNTHVKQEWCETSRKYLRKWLKTWIIICFGAQNDPEIGPLSPIFNIPLKIAPIGLLPKTDTKPVKQFWENDQRPEKIPKFRGPKSLWGPYSPHILKYLQWACEAILKWNQWKRFEKVIKDKNFDLLWGPKWLRNWAFETHIVHLSESSSNRHIEQDWCESRGKFFAE